MKLAMHPETDAAGAGRGVGRGALGLIPASVLWLVVLATIARLLYLALLCPFPLVEDEAQYWVWSTRPDWSYYSKGPGIAWSIWLSVRLTEWWAGLSEFGVRWFAPLYGAVTALAAAGLAVDLSRDRRAGFYAASVVMLLPMTQVLGSFVMTIDSPFVACWALGLWAGWRCLDPDGTRARWRWGVLGVALALGFVFKYTMVLLLPLLLIAAIAMPRRARIGFAGPSLALGIALLGLLPVALWNAQHEWVALRHLMGHLKLPGGDVSLARPEATGLREPYSVLWTLEYLGVQAALFGPSVVLVWIGARHLAAAAATRAAGRFGVVSTLFLLVLYGVVSFWTPVEANWALAATVGGSVLAGVAAGPGMAVWHRRVAIWKARVPASRRREGLLVRRPESVTQVAWHASVGYGVLLIGLVLAVPILASVDALRTRFATHRILGVETYIARLHQLAREHKERTGAEPLLISYHYGIAAQMTFYLPNHPMVRVAGSRLGVRRTQWDLWPDLDLADPSLVGRDALLVGGSDRQWSAWFDRVQDLGVLPEDPRRSRWTYVGERFRGPVGARP